MEIWVDWTPVHPLSQIGGWGIAIAEFSALNNQKITSKKEPPYQHSLPEIVDKAAKVRAHRCFIGSQRGIGPDNHNTAELWHISKLMLYSPHGYINR